VEGCRAARFLKRGEELIAVRFEDFGGRAAGQNFALSPGKLLASAMALSVRTRCINAAGREFVTANC